MTDDEKQVIDRRLDELLRPCWWEYEGDLRAARDDVDFLLDILNDPKKMRELWKKREVALRVKLLVVECDTPDCESVAEIEIADEETMRRQLFVEGWQCVNGKDLCEKCADEAQREAMV